MIDFEKVHWDQETLEIEKEFPGYLEAFKSSIENSNHKVFEKDGKVVGIGCYIEYLPRHFYIFLVSTKYTKEYPLVVARESRKMIDEGIKTKDPLRIGTESLDNDFLNRWHMWLGFILEGVKRNYFGKRNFNIWRLEGWAQH
jgi:hypothetical protein